MNALKIFLCSLAIACVYFSCKSSKTIIETPRHIYDFDEGWLFTRDSNLNAEQSGFIDTGWRQVNLPHDWSIEPLSPQQPGITIGPFTKESGGPQNGKSNAHVTGGTGWYRKKFVLKNEEANKLISVYFEGVYMETDVWVNGKPAGSHKHGYTSFYFNITSLCNPPGEENVIAVRVMNNGQNSRWYSGSGIYRHVKLIVTDRVYIDPWSVHIITPQVSAEKAQVNIEVSVTNEEDLDTAIILKTRILNQDEKEISSAESHFGVNIGPQFLFAQQIELNNPELWSPEHPYIYKAQITILKNGKAVDEVIQNFGIRNIEISAEKGFLINGIPIELKGGCVHHDNGILGSVAIDRAEERRVELLKAAGFNAIRCSHNPPSEKFLESCDRKGMLVIDEAFDHWQKPKNTDDYHKFFDKWWEKDLTSMIRRDRNHPSIILWSIGNEIEERADTSGLDITKGMKQSILSFDKTRKITEAISEFWDHPGRPWSATAPAFALLDVGGYNYQWMQYEKDHAEFPQRIMMGTESVPIHAAQNWNLVEMHPYVIGDFVWTAMDYLGESGIGHAVCENNKEYQLMSWPWFNANCGDIDITGNKKPQALFRDVLWRNSKIEIAVHAPLPPGCNEKVSYWGWPDEQQSWNWKGQEGNMMQVNIYSRAPKVRLHLNGKLIGEKPTDSLYTAKFELSYMPGELTATAFDNGKEIANKKLRTTGVPKSIRLTADRSTIHASRNDLSYVTVDVLDENGNIVPDAGIPISFSSYGSGQIAATGNADPSDMESFRNLKCKTYRGRCLVILQPDGKGGNIRLEAKADGLTSASVVVTTKM